MLNIDAAFRSGKIAEIEQEGFEARLQQVPLTDNPYIDDSWEHEVWENGHTSAEHMNTRRYSAHH